MRPDIVPGAVFPDYALPDHTDTVRTLSELQGEDPLILTLVARSLLPQGAPAAPRTWRRSNRRSRSRTPRSPPSHRRPPHPPGVPCVGRRPVDLPLRPGRIVQKDLDIQEYTDPNTTRWSRTRSCSSRDLIIHSIYNGYWFWGRPSEGELWRDLRAATSDSRPDWDLSTPGLRESWDAGDLSRFHGWDRRSSDPVAPT